MTETSGASRIEVRGISKVFGAATVLDGVELSVHAGEIHGLIGQNGSGKSTLVKILTGYHRPGPGGSLHIDGRNVRLPVAWRQAHAAGLSVVHQDLGLLDQLSVAENICVGGYVTSGPGRRIDWKAQREIAQRVLTRLDVDLEPAAPVAGLSAAERADVAIARALRDVVPGTGLIILDESTRALGKSERTRFHHLLRRVVATGTSVLMVSHDLEEILEVTNRVTVLRDGRLAGKALASKDLTEAELARRMLGKDVSTLGSRRPSASTSLAMRARGVCGDSVESIDLTLTRGEVVGLTGLPGSGFESIPYLLSGAQRPAAGTVEIGGRTLDLSRAGVSATIRAGIVLVPERRDRDGLAFELSVRDNITLPTLRSKGRPWFVGRRWQEAEAREAIATLNIRPNAPRQLVKEMSGGNQQKVLLAKWLTTGPQVMILHEPTQAVDVGARQDILRTIQRVADSGIAVLIVSVEAADLVAVCDRVLVYSTGQSLEELRSSTAGEVLDLVYSSSTNRHVKERM